MKLRELLQSDPDYLYRRAVDLRQGKAGELALQTAHRMLLIAALSGGHAARYHLGLMNLRGEGRERNRVRALMWFRLAGGRDEPRAARQASELAADLKPAEIREVLQLATHFEEAEALFRTVRSGENIDALATLGAMLMQGEGLDQDVSLGVECLMPAAEKNHAEAQWRLGVAYSRGDGVIKNRAEASRWLQRSVAQGNRDAQYHQAQLIEQQSSHADARAQAMRLYEAAARQGHVPAQLHLAHALRSGEVLHEDQDSPLSVVRLSGRRSTAPHLVQSLNFFRLAAEQGHADAQFQLGQMYAQGLGTTQQFDQAADWYLRAAKQGHAKAPFHLGFLYAHGQGVEQDDEKAYQWYYISAQCGYALARKNMALIGKKLSAGEREMAQWRADSFVFNLRTTT